MTAARASEPLSRRTVATVLSNAAAAASPTTGRAPDRTLVDDEVNSVMDKILSALKDEFGAILREQ